MALLPGSPAINAGNNALIPAGVTTDQRGFARIVDGTVDIGAYEYQAVALVVNTTADGIAVPLGKVSLRGAVDLANVTPGAQTVTFDPTVFATPQTITLTEGQIDLANTTGLETIMGNFDETISGGGLSRVFEIESGVTASLFGLAITDGSTKGNGGGVNNNGGTLSLEAVTFTGNVAANGGGLYSDNPSTTILSCDFIDNDATLKGGGVDNDRQDDDRGLRLHQQLRPQCRRRSQ